MDIYNNKSGLKIALLAIALLIGGLSLYYTDSLVKKLAEREKKMIDLYAKGLELAVKTDESGNLAFLFQEIIEANNSIPVILANDQGEPVSSKNVEIPPGFTRAEEQEFFKREMVRMMEQHAPIKVEFLPGSYNFIYYKNSYILTQLQYYPLIQLTIIGIFALMGYLAFDYSRNAEQNRVWVGLAKETAHQLGTPLSSLIGWNEIFKSDPDLQNNIGVQELEKDIHRLEMITSRFSNIGSKPSLKDENVYQMVQQGVAYLQNRVSSKVNFILPPNDLQLTAKANASLMDWVIENICKNAIDAMEGRGTIRFDFMELDKGKVAIDISDSGKGIPKSKFKEIFRAGFTTKQRGWGLGLTLVKRIVESYHKGKIFVLASEPEKGTTFRIILNR
ncbi:MAG: HAMP domain-containing histidine kinase [Cytophagales bacterium]|nr:HAMP domain-containing histidine kinase [Cytophagales bacterium]